MRLISDLKKLLAPNAGGEKRMLKQQQHLRLRADQPCKKQRWLGKKLTVDSYY